MIQPLGDRIAVVKIEEDLKTETGILIPATMTDNAKGEVVAVGKDATVKVGEVILYPKNAGVVRYEDYIIIKQYDVIGIIN